MKKSKLTERWESVVFTGQTPKKPAVWNNNKNANAHKGAWGTSTKKIEGRGDRVHFLRFGSHACWPLRCDRTAIAQPLVAYTPLPLASSTP